MHRAQQHSSQAAQLLPEGGVTRTAFQGSLGLQICHAEGCLVEQPDMLRSSVSIHTPVIVEYI